jgi:putative hydrolase of the HAD superfamily
MGNRLSQFRLLVFDGDDTLWNSINLYAEAKNTFIALLESNGFPTERTLSIFEEINTRNVQVYGFTRERFPISMVQAYRNISANSGRSLSSELETAIRSIGESVFEREAQVIPSVAPVLSELTQQYSIVLCTKGSKDIQQTRIDHGGLRRYFSKIYIVDQKGEAEFISILKDFSLQSSDACSIGNSLRSDINPALRIGMWAVWIPSETWAAELEEEIVSSRLTKITSFTELKPALQRLESQRSE